MGTEKDNPVFDERTLAKVLEAAYVLQEHNRELQQISVAEQNRDQVEARETAVLTPAVLTPPNDPPQIQGAEPAPKSNYTHTLAQMVENQRQTQVRHVELEKVMSLVTEGLIEITGAGGAAIGILEGKNVRYEAAAGLMTLPVGTEIPLEKALCVVCLRTGQVFRCPDVNPEFLVDGQECQRRGIQSLIAIPVYHDGGVVGGLEVYFSSTQAFTEQEVSSCQLMAGLLTEVLARKAGVASKKPPAAERTVGLEAPEKLKANLAGGEMLAGKAAGATTTASSSASVCLRCGHELMSEERFCGQCGSSRGSDYAPPSLQSRVASIGRMQEATKLKPPADSPNGGLGHEESREDWIVAQLLQLLSEAEPQGSAELPEPVMSVTEAPAKTEPATPSTEIEAKEATAPTTAARPTVWSSAANARNFLEQLAPTKPAGALARTWNARRGDIYLGIAVILVACVIRWGIWSSHSVNATGKPSAAADHRKPAPDADLSPFDRMLINLGLAEAPPAPENKGNPDTRVWVDLHTALYYCPGADLYGKTPKGEFTTQRDAQLDQFEPAYRKACQ